MDAEKLVLLGLYTLLTLLDHSRSQSEVVEEPLQCFQSSTNCSGANTSLPYSNCCSTGTGSFTINNTCYMCSNLLSFTATSYEVREGEQYIGIEVRRAVNPGTSAFFFSTIINDLTALAGVDYGQFPDTGIGLINVVLEGESLVDSVVVIIDDNIVEYNENFTVSLQPLSKNYQPLGGIQDTALVTIIDDDQVDITLDPSGPLSVRESSVLSFTLNSTGVAARPVQVVIDLSDPELQFSNGTQPDSRTFTFEPNDPPKMIEIQVIDDSIVEATEEHVIRLRAPVGETGVNLPRDSEIINVLDDGDTVSLGLSAVFSTVEETDGTVSVMVEKTGQNERPVFVRVFTDDISTTGGMDYSVIDRVMAVPSDGGVTISVNVSADRVVEETESFNLFLEVPPTENGVQLNNNVLNFSITDTDFLMVNISATRLEVTEGESVRFSVSGSGAELERNVEISISANINGGDVEVSPSTVILTENQLQSSVTITGFDDDLYEGAEFAELSIMSSDRAVQFAASSQRVNVDIKDNDSPQISFSEEVYMFNETQGTASISISFAAATETSHSWNLTSIPNTATEGDDYTGINEVLTFSDTMRTETVSFTIFDDQLSEGIESFRLELRGEGELTNSSLVQILDDEKLELSFTNSTLTVSEGEAFFSLTIMKSGVTTSDITVNLNITDGSATGGVDYGFFPTPVFPGVTVILANETSIHFRIPIINDDLVENPETFSVALVLRDTGGTVVQGEIGKTTVTIQDDDKVEVFLEVEGRGEVNEGGSEEERELVFTVSRNENVTLTRSVSVVLSTTDDSAIAANDDYDPVSVTFTFAPNRATSFTQSIRVLNDSRVENRERFFVGLSPFEGETALILPENDTAVYIIDDDNIQVDFVGLTYTVSESDGTAVVLLSKSGENEIPVMVSVVTETQDATAVAGEDYNATIEPVEFLSTQDQVPINIPILDDDRVEEIESFTVVLSIAGTDDNVVIGPQNTTQVTIIDNDMVTVRFEQTGYTGVEGERVSVAVELSAVADRTIELGVSAVLDGTANDTDFSLPSTPITLSPGVVRETFDVILTQDSMCDADIESFSLNLLLFNPAIAVLGAPSSTQISIVEDDSCTIQFMNGTMVTVDEMDTDSQISLCVGLGDNLILDREVTFALVAVERTDLPVDQQALPGVDYEFDPLIMTLEPPANMICFNVTILTDNRAEITKFFNVTILPEDPQFQPAMIMVAIASDIMPTPTPTPMFLPTVEFSADTYSVMETAGVVEITLDIFPPPTDAFLRSVVFSTVDGTATAPEDYAAQTDSIITIDGSTARILVDIVTDNRAEGEERFTVNIRIPDGVLIQRLMLGSRTSATVIIGDRAPEVLPTVEFSADTYSVMETAGVVEITLNIFPPPNDTFPRSVVFSTVDGTATAPEDYAAQTDSIITIDGSTARILVDIVTDNRPEGEERFTVNIRIPDGVLIQRLMLGSRTSATVIISDPPPEGEEFVNDTVTGDPFFIVPLSLTTNSSDFQQEPALCYEIHGSSGQIFNLVSDTCTSVNAYYRVSSVDSRLNFISDIGVRAVDGNGNCVNIRISVDRNCTPEIQQVGGGFVSRERYESGGISVRKMGETVRISVPNCANSELVMWVNCRVVNSQRQLRFDIMRGSNLNPTSHGLLGQFWNIPVHVSDYEFTGTKKYDLQSEVLYLVEIMSPDGSQVQRQFIAEFSPITWDHNRVESCLFAGDQQGGRVLEFTTFNDPVIENNYMLYKMDNLFSTDFRFSKFEEDRC